MKPHALPVHPPRPRSAVSSKPPTAGAAALPSGAATFRDVLASVVGEAAAAERQLARSLASVSRRAAGPEELIAMQAAVYRASRDFELLSKLVDKSTAAVKQTLQSGQGG